MRRAAYYSGSGMAGRNRQLTPQALFTAGMASVAGLRRVTDVRSNLDSRASDARSASS